MRKPNRHIVTLLLTLIVSLSAAAQIHVEADTTHIRIGEQIRYSIISDSLHHTVFPEQPALDSLHRLEMVESLPVDTLKKRLMKTYLITGFDTGYYHIPAPAVRIGDHIYKGDSLDIKVSGVAVDTTRQKLYPARGVRQAPDIKITEYIQSLGIWWIAGLILVLAAVIYYLWFRKKQVEEQTERKVQLPPLEEALEALSELGMQSISDISESKQFYSQLTGILRHYLERKVELPALELPTGEWMYLLRLYNRKNRWGLTGEEISQIEEILQRADMIKFAKQSATPDRMSKDLSSVEEWIKNFSRLTYQPEEEVKTEDLAVEETKKYKNKRLAWAFGILFVAGLVSGWWYFEHKDKSYDTSTWYKSTYGYPAVLISTPDVLEPADSTATARGESVYRYHSPDTGLDFELVTGAIAPQTEIQQVIDDYLKVWKEQNAIEDFKKEQKETEINGTPVTELDAIYSEKGKEKYMKAFFAVQDKGKVMWIFHYSPAKKKAEEMMELILKSVYLPEKNNE